MVPGEGEQLEAAPFRICPQCQRLLTLERSFMEATPPPDYHQFNIYRCWTCKLRLQALHPDGELYLLSMQPLP